MRKLPNHPTALYHLGTVLHALGKNDEAKEHLKKALSVSSTFSDADAARAILKKLGD